MSRQRSIFSLDGLRALSISLVMVAHLRKPADIPGHAYLESLGPLGVSIFFVISGFLITHMLQRESVSRGCISLRRFYVRRCFRIFPPFYTYLAILGVLSVARMITLHLFSYLSAATYVSDYYGLRYLDWDLIHTWSLSIEEKFYLLWPLCLLLLSSKQAVRIAVGLFLVSPILRATTYAVAPSLRPHMAYMFHTRIDTLMCGCLIALLYEEPAFGRLTRQLFRPAIVGASVLFLFVGSPFCVALFRGYYGVLVGPTLEALCIGLLLLYVVGEPRSFLGRILNMKVLRHIGVISYSLYLWQQPFLPRLFFPLNVLLAFTCAELSYWWIERPSQRMRDALGQRTAAAAVTFIAQRFAR